MVWDPGALTSQIDLFVSPGIEDIATALVVSTVALAGIEAASDLAPDLAWRGEDLRRVLRAGTFVVPFVYVGMSLVALMALPVVDGPDGPQTALATTFVDAPVLGVTAAFEPPWLSDVFQWAVVAIAPVVLLFAANVTTLGLSRHVYVLATNRQIPSWLGKLGGASIDPTRRDPDRGRDRDRAGPARRRRVARRGLRVRRDACDLDRPSLADPAAFHRPTGRAPTRCRSGSTSAGTAVPVPALIGLALTGAGLLSLVILHGGRLLGRRRLDGLRARRPHSSTGEWWGGCPLTTRVSVPEQALLKHQPDVELDSVLVPVLGAGGLDDDIVSTACRLAESNPLEGQSGRVLRSSTSSICH